ncbi:exodeoxyribonuclease VII large subunit [Oceanicaulis sp. MMSF_3324]|uniref:exodeoxyribonuclease VII large subunit n=1 Tax=Oceanicaulis sp. MMSF_3324 TaxID=3046702 RepID=UPI00273D09AB|nr:exodeoxyribonuclease VII large subunit [Oceanicaulis sp. MMSF_3324]
MTDATASNTPEYTVSELSNALKRTVEQAYDHVRVRGELGRVTVAKSGHVYLDMKDDKAVIDGVMWKGVAAHLNFRPEEGLEVIAEGRLSTFPGRSKYQMIIERMEPAGEGALMALLEARKKALAAEGLFSPDRKRALPFLPRVIGVVTSPTGAVIRDILHRLDDRFPTHVLLWPVLVQGDKAADQVAHAIEGFNALEPGGAVPVPDVLIVARGGGSIEDLWCFNEERVVRAAAASRIPLISAVGHETDTTLIDYASDRRAPTPTGAAEIAVPVRRELVERISTTSARLMSALVRGLDRKAADLKSASRGLPTPRAMLNENGQKLDFIASRLNGAAQAGLERKQTRLQAAALQMRPTALRRDLAIKTDRFEQSRNRLDQAFRRELNDQSRALTSLGARLEALSHKSVLKRGFALVKDDTGALVRQGAALQAGQSVSLVFDDATRQAVIDGVDAGTPPPAPAQPVARPKSAPKAKKRPSNPDQGSLF